MKKTSLKITSALLCMMMVAGCSSKKEAQSNTITTEGSTSMQKMMGTLIEAYQLDHSDINISYNPTGSTSGITSVLEGRCEIGLSSRKLKQEEIDQGLDFEEIAQDGIAIIVNPKNPIDDISVEDLSNLFVGKTTNWKELKDFDQPVVLIGREAGSGTRDGFESILEIKDQCAYRQELTSTGDVVATVSKNEAAIGYASLGAVNDSVKVLKINGVVPNEKTIQDHSYLIQRPFLFVFQKDKQLQEQTKQFLDFVHSEKGQEWILKAGVIPLGK